ncbi:MAG: GreA/GreB family elongation factor [Candidatus Eisenbacteria bacterium]|nr:GreA/GreB family elongation factor [Candidatus Eisenbacteria bacterium]
MYDNRIEVTDLDAVRLRTMVAGVLARFGPDRRAAEELRRELDRANVVPSLHVDPRVVTMHSRVRLRDEVTGGALEYLLVYPQHADLASGRLSVLAPIGTAILGYREGDLVAWDVPAGTRRFRIEKVLHQPEAAGQDHVKTFLTRSDVRESPARRPFPLAGRPHPATG